MNAIDNCSLKTVLKDPAFLSLYNLLEHNNSAGTFLRLYELAINGKLKDHSTFTQICDVLADRVRRLSNPNQNARYGIRYPSHYINFMTLLRSFGGNSARQYEIVTSQIGGPSIRHMR
jgi:hypothetical protein